MIHHFMIYTISIAHGHQSNFAIKNVYLFKLFVEFLFDFLSIFSQYIYEVLIESRAFFNSSLSLLSISISDCWQLDCFHWCSIVRWWLCIHDLPLFIYFWLITTNECNQYIYIALYICVRVSPEKLLYDDIWYDKWFGVRNLENLGSEENLNMALCINFCWETGEKSLCFLRPFFSFFGAAN